MTDNEIIKALKCCQTGTCVTDNCPLLDQREDEHRCIGILLVECKHLINRQKAEIKKLKGQVEHLIGYVKTLKTEKDNLIRTYAECQAEAVKEFAENAIERVEKAKLKYQRLCKEQGEEMEEHMHIHFNGMIGIIGNLLKEKVGDEK